MAARFAAPVGLPRHSNFYVWRFTYHSENRFTDSIQQLAAGNWQISAINAAALAY